VGYLFLVFLWLLYGLIHSLFAAKWMKNLFFRFMGSWFKYYRLIYSTLATIMLIPILWYQSTLSQRMLFPQQVITLFTGLTMAASGIMVVKVSFHHYDLKEFLGMYQLKGAHWEGPLKTEGILSTVRHPLYSGSILALLGYVIFAPTLTNLVMAICLIMYFIIGIHFEEKKLILEFGDHYREYRRQVPALIPGWKKIFRNRKNPKKN
jgi:protein-S-isoprenylcysteine O-methyltransferase Ste14